MTRLTGRLISFCKSLAVIFFFTFDLRIISMGNWDNIQRFEDQYFINTFPGLKFSLFILGITIYQGNNSCYSLWILWQCCQNICRRITGEHTEQFQKDFSEPREKLSVCCHLQKQELLKSFQNDRPRTQPSHELSEMMPN